MQRIKDRATNQGLQAGTGGQNLSGYRQDRAATLTPDQLQPKRLIILLLRASRNLPSSKSPGASTIA